MLNRLARCRVKSFFHAPRAAEPMAGYPGEQLPKNFYLFRHVCFNLRRSRVKSFLLLFSKKEALSCSRARHHFERLLPLAWAM
jgi:hypothetical protein